MGVIETQTQTPIKQIKTTIKIILAKNTSNSYKEFEKKTKTRKDFKTPENIIKKP